MNQRKQPAAQSAAAKKATSKTAAPKATTKTTARKAPKAGKGTDPGRLVRCHDLAAFFVVVLPYQEQVRLGPAATEAFYKMVEKLSLEAFAQTGDYVFNIDLIGVPWRLDEPLPNFPSDEAGSVSPSDTFFAAGSAQA